MKGTGSDCSKRGGSSTDPLLHYYRTLDETGDEELAWMSFAADLTPAKRAVHDWIWRNGGKPNVDGKIWVATLIHAIQDIIWSVMVRNHIQDEENPWNYRGAEILWTRRTYPWAEPDMGTIRRFLSAYGGMSEDSFVELETLRFLYTCSERDLMEWLERKGADTQRIAQNARIIDKLAENGRYLEKQIAAELISRR